MLIRSLRGPKEFHCVRSLGRQFRGHLFSVYALSGCSKLSGQLGITISRKVGNSVTRNKLRRRIKHIMSGQVGRYSIQNLAVDIIAKKQASRATFSDIVTDLSSAMCYFSAKSIDF